MKAIRFVSKALSGIFCSLLVLSATAQIISPGVPTSGSNVAGAVRDTAFTAGVSATTTSGASADSDSASTTHLDNAVVALNKGDKATTSQELQTGISQLEAEAKQSSPSFKDKLLAQVSKLKTLLPLIAGGGLTGNTLQKAVGLAKLASGGSKLDGLLSAGSLIGKGSQLTSSLTGLSSAMSLLGGPTQAAGGSLISTALAGVSKLNQGGVVAKAAEPAVKSQLGSVLNFVKGAL
jgi:hypothetical protein